MKRLTAIVSFVLVASTLFGTTAEAIDRSKYEGVEHSWVDGSEPDMPVWNNKAQGFRPQKADKRKQVVIDERFVVPKGKTKTFKNKIVWMRSKTNKEDHLEVYGTLRFINCLILWKQRTHKQNQLQIKKGGSLYIKDSYAFSGNQYWFEWDYEDGSKVELDNYVGDAWTTIDGAVKYTAKNFSSARITFFSATKNTRVVILNANTVAFEIFPPEGSKSTITLPKVKRWTNWSLNSVWPKTKIIVKNSYLRARDVALENNVHLTVKNSTDGFGFGWTVSSGDKSKPVNCTIKNLGNPNKRGTYYRKKVWRLPCNNSSLTIINSKLLASWPNIYGYGTLKIYRSYIDDLVNGGTDDYSTKMEVYDSSVLFAKAQKGSRIYLHNVTIRDNADGGIFADGSTIYGYKVRSGKAGGKLKISKLNGGKYIKLTSPGPPW